MISDEKIILEDSKNTNDKVKSLISSSCFIVFSLNILQEAYQYHFS